MNTMENKYVAQKKRGTREVHVRLIKTQKIGAREGQLLDEIGAVVERYLNDTNGDASDGEGDG